MSIFSEELALAAPSPVIVVGAGTMGVGIAQIALAAGHDVRLVDTNEAQLGRAQAEAFKRLIAKGASEEDLKTRLSLHTALSDVGTCWPTTAEGSAPVVIEAIIENLEVKRGLLAEAQELFGAEGVYATNTSSYSVTAIAAGVPSPDRVVGMHFFNPVPLMKLVEIIPGVQSDPAVVERVFQLAEHWGKTPIRTRSTPGFIVNRVARPYYGESLRLAEEGLAPFDLIDRLLRETATFRMGPFELMDLVGNDVNSAVTRTVWEGHHFDPRFAPSNLQSELVAAGRFGRKTGRGFYDYADGAPQRSATPRVEIDAAAPTEEPGDVIAAFIRRLGIEKGAPGKRDGAWDLGADGVVGLTSGRTAAAEGIAVGVPTIVLDRPLDMTSTSLIAYAMSDGAEELERMLLKAAEGAALEMVPVKDLPGLAVARVVSMLINEASEVVHVGQCTPHDVDEAMKLGTNYPLGLLEWGDRWGSAYVEGLIDALADQYRDPRYRTSLTLRRASLTGGKLLGPAHPSPRKIGAN